MKKLAMVIGGVLFFYANIWADGFQRPEYGLAFNEIQKIKRDIGLLYQTVLQSYLQQYTQGTLNFGTNRCQIREPQIGCLTFRKNRKSWSVRVDFNISRVPYLYGFDRLDLMRKKSQRMEMILSDPKGNTIRFRFQKEKIQSMVLLFKDIKIRYAHLESIISDIGGIYNDSLKDAMRRYSGEQWTYPMRACDPNYLMLGCVAYKKNSRTWLVLVNLNQTWRNTLFGFRQIFLRKRQGGLGELQLKNAQGGSLYFPIVNRKLEEVFIPMLVASRSNKDLEAAKVK